jgi:glutathione S-transferase
VNLDGHLTDYQKAISHAVGIMLEDHLYWAILYSRWMDDNWPKLKQYFFASLPPLVNKIVPTMIQNRMKTALEGQGMGRHSPEEIYELALTDLRALSDILGDQPYLMGDKPSSVDATMFAFTCNIVNVPLASPMKEYVQRSPRLMAYNQRMGERLFPDFFVQ